MRYVGSKSAALFTLMVVAAGCPAKPSGPKAPSISCPGGSVATETTQDGGRAQVCMGAGERNGAYARYYPDGAPAETGQFAAGAKDGRWVSYYSHGKVELEATYQAGVLHGNYVEHYSFGGDKTQGVYEGGKKTGIWRGWHPNGAIAWETPFIEDHEHGVANEYWPRGGSKSTVQYAMGREDGPAVYWHPMGNKAEQGEHAGGKRVGLWRGWYENGQPSIEGSYSATGEKIGVWTSYDIEGNVQTQEDLGGAPAAA